MQAVSHANIVDETLESILEMITAPIPKQTAEQSEAARIVSNAIRATVRQIVSFVFLLDTVEQTPAFGALIGVFFDLAKAALLMSAGSSTTILPALIGLIPLPLAGTVGTAIGWFISVGFLMAYASVSLSRKEFSDAMRSVLMMVPVVGSVLGNTFQSAVGTGTRLANRYEKLKMQVESLWYSMKNAADRATELTSNAAAAVQQNVALKNTVAATKQAMNVMTEIQDAPLPKPKVSFPPVPVRSTGGNRFTRRKRIGRKWKTAVHRRRSRKL